MTFLQFDSEIAVVHGTDLLILIGSKHDFNLSTVDGKAKKIITQEEKNNLDIFHE